MSASILLLRTRWTYRRPWLSQLGNRIQHALRAFTPRDQKAVRAAAETFRPNPDLNTERVITELGVGEALVSTLEGKGIPSVVQRTLIRPPCSRLGPVTQAERRALIQSSPVFGTYERTRDRTSAYEVLMGRAHGSAETGTAASGKGRQLRQETWRATAARDPVSSCPTSDAMTGRVRKAGNGAATAVANVTLPWKAGLKSAARSLGSSLGRALVRGLLGSLKRGN